MSSAKWRPFCLGLNVLMDLLIVPFYNILFVYTWNDFSWLIMCDYTVWIVFYDLFALSENDEIKMINQWWQVSPHYNDVIMSVMASQISIISIVYSTVCSGEDQRKHERSASLAFVMGIHRWPVNPRHKGPVTRKMFPFDDVIMQRHFFYLFYFILFY